MKKGSGKSVNFKIDSAEVQKEIIDEFRRELDRGADKVISVERYPIRWYFLQTLVGMCLAMLTLFFLNLSPLPELPHAIQFWGVLLLSPAINAFRLWQKLKVKP